MANITHESALALWNSLPVGINYQYIYNTTGVPPTSDLGAGNTTSNSAQLSGLSPDTHYYLYMRTQCTNNETSDWEPTEFTTMIECQAPDITLIPLSNTDKQATWSEIPTAVAYEYAVNSSPTPPSLGTLIYTNNVKFSIPNDDKGYYLHVRSKCVSIFTSSEWSTKTVREPSGTAISNVNAGDNLLLMAYPNPSTGVINVDLNGLQNNAGTVTLTDIMGKALYSTQATNSSLAIDMTHLPAGIYIIKYSDKNQNQVLKVTKQ
ncbi:MAG: T9SS type A sorting domain-containing protein [Sphingobacteriales bacterium]|nr:MAG: T9SS type A sorting domain-containing protein [Sphingobacteriales bacterium]